ncbi:Z1 domain-containing protein [Nocardia harenae]|uniref:Z1 domain-containing protein n=1 Tax=Nocardia harenae TaxID=358707 RepID=UPI00082E37CB|nr:Z1 domain-containing protein [Nocardia harenae]
MTDAFFQIFAQAAREDGVESALNTFRGNVPDDKLAAMYAEYQRLVQTISQGEPSIIANAGVESWYPGPLPRDKNWKALRTYLESKPGWAGKLVESVDRSSTKVVAYTPHPDGTRWRAKGLVVGYVQSGKTTNFTAVIAKAADLKYRLVVVLSGIHNGLRKQTQDRLISELTADNQGWIELTTSDDDFRQPTMSMASLLHRKGAGTALAVVKKNKAPLTRLRRWIQDAADQKVLGDLPVLIIDDEADQASVDTKTINPLIMDIIGLLPRVTYIGYTATPFANVLIDPAAENLYPSDFILGMDEPDGYFGTERIFGRDLVEGEDAEGVALDGYDMIRLIDDDDLPQLRPASRKDIPKFDPDITESLAEALRWFWLATAARRVRGDRGHSSMLVHTHLNTAVHDSFKWPLIEFRDTFAKKLRAGDEATVAALRVQWETETGKVLRADFSPEPQTPFDDVLARLESVVTASRIIVDNSFSEDRLDYSEPEQTVIAVGGNTLSRGLTLEGLVVSFFVRTSTAYDTLLQMARWFGFRRGYEDLPRIWMTSTLREWFRHLATVEREIRYDIKRYEEQSYTPEQVAVRIRTHPKLAVTAKMGAWKPVASSYSDQRVQTRYFIEKDAEWLQANRAAADGLVQDARADGAQPERHGSGMAVLFRDVRADRIDRFLSRYRVHKDSPDLDPRLLRSYIEKERSIGKLDLWTVALMGEPVEESDADIRLGGVGVRFTKRSALKGTPADRSDIKTLMSKEHRVIDLDISAAGARAKTEDALRTLRNADPVYRKRGLLLIYPIDPKSEPDQANTQSRRPLDAAETVIGLALVFPESSDSKDNYIAVDLEQAGIALETDADAADAEGEAAAERDAVYQEA